MIGVIGVSYRTASLEILEKFSSAFSQLPKNPGVLLQTCNRVEWYFSSPVPSETHETIVSTLRPHVGNDVYSLFSLFGAECFYHLSKVTSGLDSVFIGETEIQGQVKTAYEIARKQHLLPKELHLLFQKALHTGKLVRSLLKKPLHCGLTERVVQLIFDSPIKPSNVLFIGASKTNQRIGSVLAQHGISITISNRTQSNAEIFARELNGKVLPWEVMENVWHRFPCVIAATKASTYLLKPPVPDSHQLLIDLGVPRNIDPALALECRNLYNIEAFTPPDIHDIIFHRTREDFFSVT